MPELQYVIRVLVGSPSDVTEEREILEEVVRELNATWSKALGLRFELLRWETAARPGVGTDPQDVINRQIGDSYDIFIGILWSKFGTPTPRASSGTAEEFERAYRRFQADPKAVSLMFYFCETPLSPARIEPAELARVQAFRSSLGPMGVLWWSYPDKDSFAQFLRTHLARQAQEWKRRIEAPPAQEAAKPPQVEVTESAPAKASDEEEGLLDLWELVQDDIASLTEAAERIGAAITDVGSQMQKRTAEMDALRVGGAPPDFRKLKNVVTRSAEDMQLFAAQIEAHTPSFAATCQRLIERVTRVGMLQAEFTPANPDAGKQTLAAAESLIATLGSSRESTLSFRHVVAGLPRMTTNLNKARRRVVDALDHLAQEMEKASVLTREGLAPLRPSGE